MRAAERATAGGWTRWCARAGLCLVIVVVVVVSARPIVAQEDAPLQEHGPRQYLLAEPASYTSVLDAFEVSDLPDVSIGLSFRRTQSSAMIGRERVAEGETIAGGYRNVARSEQATSALSIDLASGVFRGVMVFVRLPLVLSDQRSLVQPPDAGPTAPTDELADASAYTPEAAAEGTQNGQANQGDQANQADKLFSHDYRSITRSGIPGLDIGAAWQITNQYRTAYLPTWVVQVESRVGLGKVLRPCSAGDSCVGGVSRGTLTLELDSRWSYRYRWVEPYLGLRYVHEWATGASERFVPGAVADGLDVGLPSRQQLTLGTALMVWEDRGRYQRMSIDLRGVATYISAGRDYSQLFDVLGGSKNALLSQTDPSQGELPFYGITQVDGHAQLRADLAVEAQAARYVQFRLGVSLMRMSQHLLTGAAPCGHSGPSVCQPGQANPLYRAVIDQPGQRFAMLENLRYDLFATAIGRF